MFGPGWERDKVMRWGGFLPRPRRSAPPAAGAAELKAAAVW
jgi:hypothetical protein